MKKLPINPFYCQPDKIHSEDWAVKNGFLSQNVDDFQQMIENPAIIDFNESKWYLLVENEIVLIKRPA